MIVGRAKGGWPRQFKNMLNCVQTWDARVLPDWQWAGAEVEADELACRTVYGPLGSAWDRLGPDKIFSPRAKRGKNHESFRVGSFQRGAMLRAPMKTAATHGLGPADVGGYVHKRSSGGHRRDYPGGYAGLSGTKIDRVPRNPGYSRVIPHNDFQNFLRTSRKAQTGGFSLTKRSGSTDSFTRL